MWVVINTLIRTRNSRNFESISSQGHEIGMKNLEFQKIRDMNSVEILVCCSSLLDLVPPVVSENGKR